MSHTTRIQFAFSKGLLPPVLGPVLLVAPPADPLLTHLFSEVKAWHPHRSVVNDLTASGVAMPDTVPPAPAAILCATRDRVETLALLAETWAQVPEGGWIAITGDKGDGIDGTLRQVKAACGPIQHLSKAHGKIALLPRTSGTPDAFPDWAHAGASREVVPGFQTRAGLFSADKIDPGSALLAETFDKQIKGRVADLGAGWGWLAAQALTACPRITALELFELDRRALACASQNCPDARVVVHWADVTTLPREAGPFDWVLSNPPFHAGSKGDATLGRAFIAAAARLLKPPGTALFVANRHLPYEATLTEHFAQWSETGGTGRFKLIRARKPRR